ncbi:MAG: TetR family transcriptional regulator [Burkholderiales bacterium]|nr:TetR family transcriptional regulator [Burkholderiales bacterium]
MRRASRDRPARRTQTDRPEPAAGGRRAHTQATLLAEAMNLARHGAVVTVAEVAAAAGVSRATAYRYYPSRARLIKAIVEESLGPVRRFESRELAGAERVRDLFHRTFPRFKEFEPQLRAALQLALEHTALERAGQLQEEPFRRGHRRTILARAAEPLRSRLDARDFENLLKALSLVYGIEPYVVLKDIWGASNREVDRVARWVADAVIEKALRDAPAIAKTASRATARKGTIRRTK